MNKNYSDSKISLLSLIKSVVPFRLLLIVLIVFLFGNNMIAQVASSTWALTANGNSTNSGNVTGTSVAIGAGLNSINYNNGIGVSTVSWSNDANSLRTDEYYEFEVTPNSNTIFNVTAINFEHSISNGNWQVQAYYSTDDFLTSTAIAVPFSSSSTLPNTNNNTVNINVDNTTLSVRIYGWESDAANRELRIRNVVISGTTCIKPVAASAISGVSVVCQGQNNVAYSVPAITNATGYVWTLPLGASIVSGMNTRSIMVNFSSISSSGAINVQGTNTCGNGMVSVNYPVMVNLSPTVTAAASSSSINSGDNVNLTASSSPTAQNAILLSEGFNDTTNFWTKINNSTGGTVADAAWKLRQDGYVYNYGGGYPVRTFHSNDNSQFYLSNSADQSGGVTATILQSPAMNSSGYTSLSLEFYQYNLDFDNTDYARVEVSTNGSSWVTLSNTTTTQGAENNFLKTTINLDAYINQSSLYVRFKYDAQFDWFWAIDNVTISGNKTIAYTYSWTALPSGTAGMPSGAGTSSASNASIIANPTQTTSYTATAINSITGCSGTSSVVTVTVLPTITNFTPTSSCVSSGASIVITGTNFTGATAVSFNGVLATYSINSNTQITAMLPSTATTGTITVATPVGTATSPTSFTVIELPTAPTFLSADIIPPDCVSATGSVTLNSLPSTGIWTLTRSGTSSAITTGTGSSTTISGLAPGTYTFTVSNATCTSLASDNVVINPVLTDIWNGTTWSTGLVPTSTQKIVFAGNFNQDVDLVGCSCKVTGSATVIIRSNRTLAITNEVEVVGGGTLTFENKASLVQINDAAVNAGNIIYKRLTNTGVRNTDYTYWSSPVSPLNLGGTGGISYNPSSLVGSIFYSYEVTAGSEDWKSESVASPMIVGKGYSIRGPGPISVSPLTLLEVTFAGKPNNGRYPITGIYPFKSYLIGNPYPSALDADKFLTDNAGVIDGTLYFWTHSTKIGIGVVNPGTGVYAYSGDDYASYNLTGGVGTVADSDPDKTLSNPNKPTGKIGAGQGFFATSNTTILGTNEIVFNNSMRVGVGGITGNNSQIFKTNSTKSKTTSAIEKNRVWLNLTNTEGAFKQLLVGYITGATNDYDNGYDGETFDGNEFMDFYSVNQNKKFVIQGRALPFDENDEVSLGYRSVAIGNFSIGIDEVDGMMQSQKVYIEDKLLNVVHDLKASSYDFTTQAGTFNDRFVLRYIDKTLGTGDFEAADDKVVISVKNKQIKIDSSDETIDKVLIFDLIGKQLYKKINVGNSEHVIPNLSSSEQALIVKIVLQNGQMVSKKVIF
ncbi:MAG: T9SS sorting signal type C domain-containing protein [Bacteroidota bacterium]